MFDAISDLASLGYDAYRSALAGSRTRDVLKEWATENEYTLYNVRRERSPESLVPGRYANSAGRLNYHFYVIEAVDGQHVRRTGLVRVSTRVAWALTAVDESMIEVRWLTGRTLDWQDQPRRKTVSQPGAGAQGWCIDLTGRHEVRWYSAGQPTDLVMDGNVEGRDPA